MPLAASALGTTLFAKPQAADQSNPMLRNHLVLVAMMCVVADAHAVGPKVHVVVGSDAPRLEQFAAKELAAQLLQLFEAQVTLTDKILVGADHVILLGNPTTNPAIQKLAGTSWPK